VIDYRDDNRHLWQYIEDSDDEEFFDDPQANKKPAEVMSLPPRRYPEWDYQPDLPAGLGQRTMKPASPGKAGDIDRLLQKHAALAKRLKRLLDLLKPQDKVRVRYQEEGSELDLDVAIRSLIDFKGGATPDPRINMSHKHQRPQHRRHCCCSTCRNRSTRKSPAAEQTILELSQEAVTLLAWAVEKLGDPFAIAGFHSNTRHDVRYLHIKGYSEGFTGRSEGAHGRHAGRLVHPHGRRHAPRRALSGSASRRQEAHAHPHRRPARRRRRARRTPAHRRRPPRRARTRPAGHLVDNIQRLPERLPELFMALTK
jgi:nitric oxide reductase NorD protein